MKKTPGTFGLRAWVENLLAGGAASPKRPEYALANHPGNQAGSESQPHLFRRLLRVSLMIFASALPSTFAATSGFQFQNPVGAGDYPDPSVIRVGEDYWATATSSEWAPHFPILHSRDLVNWEVKGYVFDK